MIDKWRECTSLFSNGTEFEIFQNQCEKCTKYRNGKCRVLTACYRAMFNKDEFPYNDLMDADGGYAGKKCKEYTTEKKQRRRRPHILSGQISIFDLT